MIFSHLHFICSLWGAFYIESNDMYIANDSIPVKFLRDKDLLNESMKSIDFHVMLRNECSHVNLTNDQSKNNIIPDNILSSYIIEISNHIGDNLLITSDSWENTMSILSNFHVEHCVPQANSFSTVSQALKNIGECLFHSDQLKRSLSQDSIANEDITESNEAKIDNNDSKNNTKKHVKQKHKLHKKKIHDEDSDEEEEDDEDEDETYDPDHVGPWHNGSVRDISYSSMWIVLLCIGVACIFLLIFFFIAKWKFRRDQEEFDVYMSQLQHRVPLIPSSTSSHGVRLG